MNEEKEKRKITTKNIFYSIFFSLIALSVILTFLRVFVFRNYQIIAQVSCDPKTEKCFVSVCDPSQDDTCPANPADQTTYYKEISKKASSIWSCENSADKNGCDKELSCVQGEQSCSYIYCNPSDLVEGEECAK